MSTNGVMKSSLVARHEKLAARARCGERKPSREPDHIHTCNVYVGHAKKHACRCGGNWEKTLKAVVMLFMLACSAKAAPPPSKAKYDSQMLFFGHTHCEYQKTAIAQYQAGTAPVDITMSYYDGEGVFLNIWQYTGDSYWLDCAQWVEKGYRGMPPGMNPPVIVYPHGYVFGNNGAVTGYNNFTDGFRIDFQTQGDVDSKTATFLVSEKAAYSVDGVDLAGSALASHSREVSYGVRNMLNAEAMGHAHRTRMDQMIEQILGTTGHFRQWLDGIFRQPPNSDVPAATGQYYIQPFMIGLSMRAAIAVWYYNHDSRVYPIVKEACLFLRRNTFWDPIKKAWVYETYAPTMDQLPTTVTGAPDLNMLILPAYGWLYSQDHDPQWIVYGDEAFDGGVNGAYLGNAGQPKQFNQNYTWSFDYLKWRDSVVVPAAPGQPSILVEVAP